ncbi:MAG TPA: carboxylesterase family protein [Candidatus Sulfotelmatobacter sp.]|nr:carboxylesterase family protein [Candidatus Sulfotelmatobacter sp.]
MKNSEKANKRLDHCGFTSRVLFGAAAIGVFTLISLATASADNSSHRPIAFTESGLVIGSTTDGGNQFLGIPYAAPPVGALRWTAPKRYGFFPGFVLQATQFGSACTQPGGIGSENCLFLNVFTPPVKSDDGWRDRDRDRDRHGLPVMFWIHGGGLINGSSTPYNPELLVKKDVIVVTFNYRLGFLGFFAQSAIDGEGHLNGNYGLMDQQFALGWVRRNIARFGGDPDRVTIFGESAGGQSVYAQLASPLASGMFRGAISESGSYAEFQDYFFNVVTVAQAETTGSPSVPSGAAIAESVGCTSQTASCLRAVPASTMVAAEPFPLYPFVDGTLLTQTIGAAFASGEFNQVPVIAGTNHDEYRLFVALDYDLVGNPILTSAEYDTAVQALWGTTLAPPVLALYPFAAYPIGGEALGASGTDGVFSCPARNVDQALSKVVPTYTYEFNDENAPPAQSAFGGLLTFPLGAYHSAELQYLFPGIDVFGLPTTLSSQQIQLSDAMVSYWTQFAKTGDPNSSGEPLWSPYSESTDEFQSLIPPAPAVESNFDSSHQCSTFWDTF